MGSAVGISVKIGGMEKFHSATLVSMHVNKGIVSYKGEWVSANWLLPFSLFFMRILFLFFLLFCILIIIPKWLKISAQIRQILTPASHVQS